MKKLLLAGIIAGSAAALVAGAFTVPANATTGAPLIQVKHTEGTVNGLPFDIMKLNLNGNTVGQINTLVPQKTSAAIAAKAKQGANGGTGAAGAAGLPGAAGQDGVPGKDGTDGKDGAEGPVGPAGASGLAGAYYSVAKYDVGDTNGGAIATVACKAQTDVAISGGVQTLALDPSGKTNNVPVSSSFPGRMDWTTNAPLANRLDGWVVQFGGNSSTTDLGAPKYVNIYALCVPGADIPVNTTYSESE